MKATSSKQIFDGLCLVERLRRRPRQIRAAFAKWALAQCSDSDGSELTEDEWQIVVDDSEFRRYIESDLAQQRELPSFQVGLMAAQGGQFSPELLPWYFVSSE